MTFTLTVSKAGTGSGYVGGPAIDCGPTCTATFTSRQSTSLTAVSDVGSTFTGWTGDCSGTGNCTVLLDADKGVTANFSKNRETVPPKVGALPSSGKRGRLAILRYRVSDNSGRAAGTITILRGRSVVARTRQKLASVRPGKIYRAGWLVPRSLAPGTLRFCVIAVDEAGNRSKQSCASLVIS